MNRQRARGVTLIWSRFAATLVIVSLLAACVTYEAIDLRSPAGEDAQLSTQVIPGDWVRVATTSGNVAQFRVTNVEPDRIASASMTYPLEEIRSIEVRRPVVDVEQRTVIVVLVVTIVALSVALLDSVEENIECTASGSC